MGQFTYDKNAMLAANETKQPKKKPESDPKLLAALPPLLKNRPIIVPPKPASVETDASGFPLPGSPYWKKHPILTQHKNEDTVRPWGEDTTAMKNPNTLPKQMLPPPPVDPNATKKKDYYEGQGVPGSGHMRYHQ